ncbi:related to putative glutathione S-transferase [Ramularia collo-cygni]|uniref:Related to putative glutathione S-transferase n=1 Tax=Ramularia collo-cygni TaxID=112498 RepID=A0A2D3UVC1_9PEZI|nr:related to putative glutathione S-transferase [Ramularia collo-cygni]CZT16037.1 related to putative glutathione S-transferase [Ramularia collo-cygni]
MSGQAILYDLSHKGPEPNTCWSPNVWKTRLILNYKKIPYTSQFIDHPNIASTLSSLNITPNPSPPPGSSPAPKPSPYTLPAIKLPNGTSLQDSAAIAPKLEETCPEPSLHLETGLHEQVGKLIGGIAMPMLKVIYPAIARNIIKEEYLDSWLAGKEPKLGMSMQEFEASGGESAWKAAEPGFVALKEFLASNKKDKGPFILGSQVCYGDFIIAALLESVRIIGDGLFERFVGYDEQLRELHEACGEWFVDNK